MARSQSFSAAKEIVGGHMRQQDVLGIRGASRQPSQPVALTTFARPPIRRFHLMSKAIRLTLLAPFALAWLCGSALAQGELTNSTKNPAQIATSHSYEPNLITRFQIGTIPNQ